MVTGHSHELEDTAERGALVPWRLLNVQALLCSISVMTRPTTTPPSPRHHIPLLEARAFQCRFIVSEDTREAVCCGAPTSGTSSWCEWHRQLVYVRPHGQERNAA
jgi:hypothetical protein